VAHGLGLLDDGLVILRVGAIEGVLPLSRVVGLAALVEENCASFQ